MKRFKEEVYRVTRKIPRGKVATYRQLARAAGRPRAYRAVGNILNVSPGMPRVPCHRVIRSDGRVGGFAGGPTRKTNLLKKEGVEVKSGKIDLGEFGFNL
jgi:O-6-methylguanine DNA methyltransferase